MADFTIDDSLLVRPGLHARGGLDPEVEWFIASLPAHEESSVRRGVPVGEAIPTEFQWLVRFENENEGRWGRPSADVYQEILEALGGLVRADGYRVLCYPVVASRPARARTRGVRVEVPPHSYDVYDAIQLDVEILERECPNYWWPIGHRWIVFTNVDGSASFLGLRSEGDRRAVLALSRRCSAADPGEFQ